MFNLICDVLTWVSARFATDSDFDFTSSDPLAGASAAWIGSGRATAALAPPRAS